MAWTRSRSQWLSILSIIQQHHPAASSSRKKERKKEENWVRIPGQTIVGGEIFPQDFHRFSKISTATHSDLRQNDVIKSFNFQSDAGVLQIDIRRRRRRRRMASSWVQQVVQQGNG